MLPVGPSSLCHCRLPRPSTSRIRAPIVESVTELPASPLTVSLPPSAKIMSVPPVPLSVTPLPVPTMTVITRGTVTLPSLRLNVSVAEPLFLGAAHGRPL